MVIIDIDSKRVWPITPSNHGPFLYGVPKDEDGCIIFQHAPVGPGEEHALLMRIDPEDARKIIQATRRGRTKRPTTTELTEELERRLNERKSRNSK
jgi:hypothetical protein